MIKELELNDLDKLNELLSTFNYKLTSEKLKNNEFLNILIYDDFKGAIVYDYIYDRIEIEYVIVDKKYRRLGIASELLNFIEKKHSNIKNITLEVKESNNIAINFYKKNGFEKTVRRKNYYENEDGILMIKKLGE